VVSHDEGDFCSGFLEKPILKDVLISSGVYVFQRSILNYLPEQGDIERTTFPTLAKSRSVKLYRHDGLFLTVNSPRELEEAEQQLKTLRK
jgi:glucose-1-phosphate thymidylyltransferase